MDPITLLIAAFVVSGMTATLPRAVVDAVATAKAASAGQWDLIDRDRERRATRVPWAERWALSWAERRRARHRQAKGAGEPQPGARAYFGDVYRGWWEDRLDHRCKKRAARPEWQFDPDRPPWHVRFDEAVLDKVEALRAGWRSLDRPPTAEPAPAPEPVEYPPGTVTFDEHGQQVPLGPMEASAAPRREQEERPVIERKGDIPDPDFEQVAPAQEDVPAERPTRDQLHIAVGRCNDPDCRCQQPTGHTLTASTATTGGTTMTAPTAAAVATEVQTNEDARNAFKAMSAAAKDLAEAAALAEKARSELAALTAAGADGMAAKRFDAGATSAMASARDAIDLGTIGDWSERADAIGAEADAGLAALDKYRDSEDIVASNSVDPTTLAATSS